MDKYLLAGISALARTKSQFDYPWFFAHSGASVLAGYFLLAENNLSDDVRELVLTHLDKVIASDELLFSPISYEHPLQNREIFLGSLAECVRAHSTTGHGVIFGTLALQAFSMEPRLFTEEVSDGLIALLRDCLNDVPNRHYGVVDYHSPDVDYSGIKYFSSARQAANYSLTLHGQVYADQAIEDTYYFLAGDLLHCVTYSHALVELEKLGYEELVCDGLVPLSRHMYLSSREHPDLEPIASTKTYDPATSSFWQRDLTEPHQIKLAYSSLALTNLLPSEEKALVFRDLSKYWSSYQ